MIVYRDLAKAVRCETSLAIRQWWGVGASTASKWRGESNVPQVNDGTLKLYGTDTSDGDKLSHATTLNEKVLESKTLQQQAANNSKEQFANSPDLTSEIMNAIIDAMDVQAELSTKALNSAEIRESLKWLMLNHLGLYESLQKKAAG